METNWRDIAHAVVRRAGNDGTLASGCRSLGIKQPYIYGRTFNGATMRRICEVATEEEASQIREGWEKEFEKPAPEDCTEQDALKQIESLRRRLEQVETSRNAWRDKAHDIHRQWIEFVNGVTGKELEATQFYLSKQNVGKQVRAVLRRYLQETKDGWERERNELECQIAEMKTDDKTTRQTYRFFPYQPGTCTAELLKEPRTTAEVERDALKQELETMQPKLEALEDVKRILQTLSLDKEETLGDGVLRLMHQRDQAREELSKVHSEIVIDMAKATELQPRIAELEAKNRGLAMVLHHERCALAAALAIVGLSKGDES